MPTKPEGPAQEPQHKWERRYSTDPYEEWEHVCVNCGLKCGKFNPPCVPATPAPSQPAGAKLTLSSIANHLRRLAKVADRDADNLWFDLEAYAEHIDALVDELAQQTAAKDAEIEIWRIKDAIAAKAVLHELTARRAAERERDSLREQVADAKNTAINYMNEASRACDEVECLRAENAALKAGKDGQQ